MRSLKLSTYLPLDDNIYFHKVVGVVIVVHSVVHTLAHLANLCEWNREQTNRTLINNECTNMYKQIVTTRENN